MAVDSDEAVSHQETQKAALDERLDRIGWALFLIMMGGLLLVPEGRVPQGTWLVGTGVIILGLIGVRCAKGIKISGFWAVIGVLALAAGVSDFLGVNLPLFPIFLILIGLAIVLDTFFGKKRA